MSPYLVFYMSQTQSIQQEMKDTGKTPGATTSAKIAGERWRALSEEQKEEYKIKAAQIQQEKLEKYE